MKVTVSHTKSVAEIKSSVDNSFDKIFQGLPVGQVKVSDQKKAWNGDTMTFSCNAGVGFMAIPIKGAVEVQEKQVVIDVDLPSFVSNFIAEDKIKGSIESQVKGLLA